MSKAIGIDLGTTYSCMAYVNDDGEVTVIKNSIGEKTTPSVVYVDNGEKGTVIVGTVARQKSAIDPQRFVERIKTQMGKDFTFHIGDEEYSPASISSFILSKLKLDAEKALGEEVNDAVITVPAYFGFAERDATAAAAKIAGLNLLQLINEPTAAACDYALHYKNISNDRTILVYDLGGGTFDITVMDLKYENGKISKLLPLTSDGDHALGGKNWDDRIVDFMIKKFIEENEEINEDDLRNDPEMKLWFSSNSEALKQQLSSSEETMVTMQFNACKSLIEITREEFYNFTEDLLNRTIDLTNKVLQIKNLVPSDISEIVLVGGSTYMPQVVEKLENEFGIKTVQYEPAESVARGAAYIAGKCFEIQEQTENDEVDNDGSGNTHSTRTIGGMSANIVVEDIINKTYGMQVLENGEEKIANLLIKDTPIVDAFSEDDFGTNVDNQQSLTIQIYESESREELMDVDYGTEIAQYDISLAGNAEPKGAALHVSFKMNNSGLLDIVVKDVANNKEFQNTVKVANSVSEEDIVAEQTRFKGRTIK